jgi:hypothetical protein
MASGVVEEAEKFRAAIFRSLVGTVKDTAPQSLDASDFGAG